MIEIIKKYKMTYKREKHVYIFIETSLLCWFNFYLLVYGSRHMRKILLNFIDVGKRFLLPKRSHSIN